MRKVTVNQFKTVFIEGGPGSGSAPRGPRGSGGSPRSGSAYKQKYQRIEKEVLSRAIGANIHLNKSKAAHGGAVNPSTIATSAKWDVRLAKVRGMRPPSLTANPRWKVKPIVKKMTLDVWKNSPSSRSLSGRFRSSVGTMKGWRNSSGVRLRGK